MNDSKHFEIRDNLCWKMEKFGIGIEAIVNVLTLKSFARKDFLHLSALRLLMNIKVKLTQLMEVFFVITLKVVSELS